MYCVHRVTNDVFMIGANNRRISKFENLFAVNGGVSFNSYFMDDTKIIVFDTVDSSVRHTFQENVQHLLCGRSVDYLVVTHAEPDHSSLISWMINQFPNMQIICTEMCRILLPQFLGIDIQLKCRIIKDREQFCTGRHLLTFITAPMVHWPEVMMVYDETDHILFSADAFGSFGAINGTAVTAQPYNSEHITNETRRYYAGVLSRSAGSVQQVFQKISTLPVRIVCPLHGQCHTDSVTDVFQKYDMWSRWQPEEHGAVIICGSVYGHTENCADIIASYIAEHSIPVVVHEAASADTADVIADILRYSHVIITSPTYNAGIFPPVKHLLTDMAERNIQNRVFGIVQNGSWAPRAAAEIRHIIEPLTHCRILNDNVTIMSSLTNDQETELQSFVNMLHFPLPKTGFCSSTAYVRPSYTNDILMDIQYGLFVLTANCNGKDNGCIINTVMQITGTPERIAIAVEKRTYTADMIARTGICNVSILTADAPFELFKHFGFQSGKDSNKFEDYKNTERIENGVLRITGPVCGVISAQTISLTDCGTHIVFIADVTRAFRVSDKEPLTYRTYLDHIRPPHAAVLPNNAGSPVTQHKKWQCAVCGFVYEHDTLPGGYRCPVCYHGAEVFEPLQ